MSTFKTMSAPSALGAAPYRENVLSKPDERGATAYAVVQDQDSKLWKNGSGTITTTTVVLLTPTAIGWFPPKEARAGSKPSASGFVKRAPVIPRNKDFVYHPGVGTVIEIKQVYGAQKRTPGQKMLVTGLKWALDVNKREDGGQDLMVSILCGTMTVVPGSLAECMDALPYETYRVRRSPDYAAFEEARRVMMVTEAPPGSDAAAVAAGIDRYEPARNPAARFVEFTFDQCGDAMELDTSRKHKFGRMFDDPTPLFLVEGKLAGETVRVIRTAVAGAKGGADVAFKVLQGDGLGHQEQVVAMTTIWAENLLGFGITEDATWNKFGRVIRDGLAGHVVARESGKTAQQTTVPVDYADIVVVNSRVLVDHDKTIRNIGFRVEKQRALELMRARRMYVADDECMLTNRWAAFTGRGADGSVPVGVDAGFKDGMTCVPMGVMDGFYWRLFADPAVEYYVVSHAAVSGAKPTTEAAYANGCPAIEMLVFVIAPKPVESYACAVTREAFQKEEAEVAARLEAAAAARAEKRVKLAPVESAAPAPAAAAVAPAAAAVAPAPVEEEEDEE